MSVCTQRYSSKDLEPEPKTHEAFNVSAYRGVFPLDSSGLPLAKYFFPEKKFKVSVGFPSMSKDGLLGKGTAM